MSVPAAAMNAINGDRPDEGGDPRELLLPNLEMAQRFLDALEPGGKFIFQIIPEKGMSSKVRAHVLEGTLQQHSRALTAANQCGAGIFVMINAGTRRNAAGVNRVRSYFTDNDVPDESGSKLRELTDTLCPPNMIVESSKGKYHSYWLTAEGPLEDFSRRQKLLARRFDADPSICDLPRVMRMPGFWHQKHGVPFQTRIILSHEEADE